MGSYFRLTFPFAPTHFVRIMDDEPKRKSQFRLIIEYWLAEVRYFFRHQLKRHLRHLLGYPRYLAGEFSGWWSSRGARGKVAQMERRQRAGRLKEEARFGFMGFLGSLGSLITSPFRFVQWCFFKLNQLRRMSLREAAAEVWMGYRSLIAGLLNRAEYLLKRLLDFPLWLRAVCLLAIVGGVAGLAASPWLIDAAKQWRSDAMLIEARELENEGRMVEAYQKSRTAAILQAGNAEAREFALKLAEEVRSPEAVWWAERDAIARDYDADSLVKLVELATRFGQPKVGLKYLGMLKESYPDHESITDSEIRILMAQRRRIEALALANEAYQKGHDGELVHQLLAEQLLSASGPVAENARAEYLDKHLLREDGVGRRVREMILLYYERFSPENRESVDLKRLFELTQNDPELEREVRAMAAGQSCQAGVISPARAIEVLETEYDLRDPEDRQDVLEIARIFGLYELTERMPKGARKEYAHLELEGLLIGPDADLDAAEAMLDQAKEAGLTPTEEAFGRAMLAIKRNESARYSEQLIKALDFVELADWAALEQRAHRVAPPEQLLEFYRESLRRWPDNSFIVGRGLNYGYLNGADEDLALWAQELPVAALKRDPYNQLFLIYLKALHGRDLPLSRYHGEKLVSQHPREAIFYIILAFAYAQSGDDDMANSVMQSFGWGAGFNTMPPFVRVCLARLGHQEAAAGLEPKLDREQAILDGSAAEG